MEKFLLTLFTVDYCKIRIGAYNKCKGSSCNQQFDLLFKPLFVAVLFVTQQAYTKQNKNMLPSSKGDQAPKESNQREKKMWQNELQLGTVLRYPNLNFLSLVRFLLMCLRASKKGPGLDLYQGYEDIGLDKSFSCSVAERFLYRPILLTESPSYSSGYRLLKTFSSFWMLKGSEAFYWEVCLSNDLMT